MLGTVSIYVFHCAEPGPLPRASHLNEIDVSDTATHSQTRTYTNGGGKKKKRKINVPLLAFIWLLLADGLLSGEPASKGNQMQKGASGRLSEQVPPWNTPRNIVHLLKSVKSNFRPNG